MALVAGSKKRSVAAKSRQHEELDVTEMGAKFGEQQKSAE